MIGSSQCHAVPPDVGRPDPDRFGCRTSCVDSVLAAQARTGDVAAFESLVQRHLHAVYRVARQLLAPDVAVDELVVEVFVRTWRALTHGPIPTTFGTWILRTTARECLEANSRSARPPPG